MKPHLFFLSSGAEQVLVTQFIPPNPHSFSLNVVMIGPFFEEMNKSRKMIANFSRAAAAQNIKVSVIDLFGTGDSGGALFEATWLGWQQNIISLIELLKEQQPQVPIVLVGIRGGALLALDLILNELVAPAVKIMLWQPVLNGQQYMVQFLRLKIAAGLVGDTGEASATTADLQALLLENGEIEVAGYRLNVKLYQQISNLNFSKIPTLPPNLKIKWLELGMLPKVDLLPISRKVIKSWQLNNQVDGYFVEGTGFWQTQVTTTCDALSHLSVNLLMGWQYE